MVGIGAAAVAAGATKYPHIFSNHNVLSNNDDTRKKLEKNLLKNTDLRYGFFAMRSINKKKSMLR